MRRGPWPERVIVRLIGALDELVCQARSDDAVAAVVLFGSYARGDFGRKSDVDLLVLLDVCAAAESSEASRAILHRIGEIESEAHLPMHLAPVLARADEPEALGPALIHALWTDGLVLYARAAALARLQPTGLAPWTLIRFSAARLDPAQRVWLSRRLHGFGRRPGLVRPPSLTLGPGALLIASGDELAIRAILDEAGATYDLLPVWREA